MARSNPGSTGPGAFLAQSLLADPALCGWRPELITVIANPISAADLADRIADLAETTIGVLLLYYVGHGVLSTRGELCLTVTSTRPNRPKITGPPWEILADVLRSCPARAFQGACGARAGASRAMFWLGARSRGRAGRSRRLFGLTSLAGCCA